MALKKLAASLSIAAALALTACNKEPAQETTAEPKGDKVLHVYNWSDYIDDSVLADFTKETGIKVTYDTFDTNEGLEAKLLAGGTGFDIVVPSSQFLGRLIQAGAFQALDKSKLSNWNNLDPKFTKLLEAYDPGNQHSIPYLWGTTGIGYNVKRLKEVFGENPPVDSWDLVFKPENMEKLKKAGCGVSMLDAQSEIMAPALNFLGKDPNSLNEADYEEAGAMLQKIAPYVTYFHSSQYINDLANGDICVAVGWNGDVGQAASRAEEAKNGVEIAFNIPKEGTEMWFDMMAIPKDAKNVDEAHQFINFILRPDVIAKISNFVAYPNANTAALPMVADEVKNDPTIYPPEDVMAKLWTLRIMPNEIDRVMTRIWTKVKTGQ